MNVLRLLSRCIIVAQLVMVCGCTSSKRMDTLHYTDFEKIDRLRDEKIGAKGVHIVIDRMNVRANKENPSEFDDYVWTFKTSINHDAKVEYQRLGTQRSQIGFRNLPINNLEDFFRIAVARHLESTAQREEKVSIDVKKIALVTSSVGKEQYRACAITISTAANGKEVETASEIKLSGSSTRFYKTSSYSRVSLNFNPEGLDVVEIAFIDALQQGLSMLIK